MSETKSIVDARIVRFLLVLAAVLVFAVGPAAANMQVPEQCTNPDIWYVVKWVGGCPNV